MPKRVVIVVAALVLVLLLWAVKTQPYQPAKALRPSPQLAAATTTNPRHALVSPPAMGSLSGTVTASNRTPIVGARVCAVDRSDFTRRAGFCTDSNDTGSYVLVGLGRGSYRVQGSSDDYTPGYARQGQPIAVTSDDDIRGIDIVLERGGSTLEGWVADATGGRVPYAIVRASHSDDGPILQVSSDAEGRFKISQQPGNVVLNAYADGYVAAQRFVVAPARDLALTLTPGSKVEGVVVARRDGTPVSDVLVRAYPAGSWVRPGSPSARSDPDGKFSIRDLAPGLYSLAAEARQWQGRVDGPLELGVAEAIRDVAVPVTAAVRVAGKVVEGDGSPCLRGQVVLAAEDGETATNPVLIGNIGVEGEVRIDGAAAGSYRVQVDCADAVPREGPERVLVQEADVDGLVWKVARGLGMRIRVEDESGQPLAGFDVRLSLPERSDGQRTTFTQTSDSKGVVATPRSLVPGRYEVEAGNGPRSEPTIVDLVSDSGVTDVLLKVPGEGAILLTATTPRGEPVDNLTVIATPVGRAKDDAAPGIGRTISTTAPALQFLSPGTTALASQLEHGRIGQQLGGGQYRIAPLESGAYEVLAHDGQNQPLAARGISTGDIQVTTTLVNARVIVDVGGSIRGRVLEPDGTPAADVWVSAISETGSNDKPQLLGEVPLHMKTLTDSEGVFELHRLASGALFSVRAERPTGAATLKRGVRSGEHVVVRLPSLGRLGGSVVDDRGRGVDVFTIQVTHADTGHKRNVMFRNAGGRWSLERVLPGTLAVVAIDEAGREAQQQVELQGGHAAEGIQLLFVGRTAEPDRLSP